jgi:hypothetical protein
MTELELLQLEIERLKHAYHDLKSEITLLSKDSNGGSLTRKRGALASAGVTCEAILKFIYKKEGMDKGAKPADSMMLEDLLQKLNVILPAHIQINLRTIQAWRNMGAHDKGDFREIDESTINMVDAALKAIVLWFFNSYLDQQFNFSEANIEIEKIEESKNESESLSFEENTTERLWDYWVYNHSTETKKHGFINRSGEIVIQPMYDKIGYFIDGIAQASINDKWGFIDNKGNWVIQPMFDDNYNFIDGIARASINDKWGFIDKKGNWVIQPMFDGIADFSDGIADASINEKWGFIDEKGNWVIQPMFDEIGDFSDGFAHASINDKWGFIDKKGNWVIQPMFDDIGEFKDGIARASINDKWGLIDKKGNWVIQPMFDDTYNFIDGFAHASINEKWGFIDEKGNWVIQPMFDEIGDFSDGIAHASINDKCGFIDKKGNWVIQPIFSEIGEFKDGIAYAVGDNYKYGLIDKNGNWVIQPIFDLIDDFFEGITRTASMNDKWGFIDKKGNWVIQPMFDETWGFTEELARVRIGDNWGYIDKKGNWVLQPVMYEKPGEGWSHGPITDEEIDALGDEDDEYESSSIQENTTSEFDEFYADDFNLEDYFGNVNSKLKIKNQIDSNKVRNFIDNIDDENIVWENFASDELWVFYDKTFWQNGKEGFLICSDANYIYLTVKEDEYYNSYSFAVDDITHDYIYITDLDIVDNNLELTLLNEDEKHYWAFSVEINKALYEFFQEEIEPRKTY